ncbi:MAG TPA: type II toxin-antitoxin system VapC family toxin [Mycobacteriales bacterium]|nr:type II toxin-antitoxin system VapC family toxin [Mycobacteriales bacterium]
MPAVVLDTNIVVALLSSTDTLHGVARVAVEEREADGATFELSAVSWAELLTGALRRGPAAVDALEAFVSASIDDVVPVDMAVAAQAAALRAKDLTLRMPDALVLATGHRPGVDAVLTGDKRLAKHASDLVEVIG